MENKITKGIRECSKVFTKSLHQENEVFMDQLNQTVALTVYAMEELMRLNNLGGSVQENHILASPEAQKALNELEVKMNTTVRNIREQTNAEQTMGAVSDDDPWKKTIGHFNTSMQNAVSAQQQMNKVSQAAMVQCVNSILHTVPPMLAGVNNKHEIKLQKKI